MNSACEHWSKMVSSVLALGCLDYVTSFFFSVIIFFFFFKDLFMNDFGNFFLNNQTFKR